MYLQARINKRRHTKQSDNKSGKVVRILMNEHAIWSPTYMRRSVYRSQVFVVYQQLQRDRECSFEAVRWQFERNIGFYAFEHSTASLVYNAMRARRCTEQKREPSGLTPHMSAHEEGEDGEQRMKSVRLTFKIAVVEWFIESVPDRLVNNDFCYVGFFD